MVTGIRELIYLLNSFYYIVEAIRNPLLGKFDLKILLVLSIMALVSISIGAFVHYK